MKIVYMSEAAKALREENNNMLLKFYRNSHANLIRENALLRQQLANYEDLAQRAGVISRTQAEGIDRLLSDLQIGIGDGDAA